MFSKQIKDLRKEKGWSQAQLARKLNITQGAVSQWENGITMPSADQLLSISLLFNRSIANLLGKSDDYVDEKILDVVNEIPNELLEKHGNVLEAQREYEAQKKEAVPMDDLDDRLVDMLVSLSPDQVQRVMDFVAGMKAADKA